MTWHDFSTNIRLSLYISAPIQEESYHCTVTLSRRHDKRGEPNLSETEWVEILRILPKSAHQKSISSYHTYITYAITTTIAVAVSATYLGLGLYVCPPVQEGRDGPDVAFLRSHEESCTTILSKAQVAQSSYITNY